MMYHRILVPGLLFSLCAAVHADQVTQRGKESNSLRSESLGHQAAEDLAALFERRTIHRGFKYPKLKATPSKSSAMTAEVANRTLAARLQKGNANKAAIGSPSPTSLRKTVQNLNATVISSLPFTISQPGAYRLDQSLSNTTMGADGISITTGNVTLDLSGFTLSADDVTPGGHGIVVLGDQIGIRILNGIVSGWSGDGINAANCDSCHFEFLSVANNGMNGLLAGFASVVTQVIANLNGQDGIDTDDASVVSFCTASENGGTGIQGSLGVTVTNTNSFGNSGFGFDLASGATVSLSTADDNVGFGFELGSASQALQSSAFDNGEDGFRIFFASMLRDNTATRNGRDADDFTSDNGYRVTANSYLINNVARDNAGAGIRVVSGDSVIENNMLIDNDRAGIEAGSGGNFILRNRASGNGPLAARLNYDIANSNAFGPIVTVTELGDISAITNADHPYVNLEY